MTLLTVHKILFGATIAVFGSYAAISIVRWFGGNSEAGAAALWSSGGAVAAVLYLRWISHRQTDRLPPS